ncbi:phage scaffolding protein [Clostridium sporogenes]|uniref:phage scaffolding protein n=1 Tax=Clostridium sporogenes TaxID=1509 RepID=UPI000697F36B|nr:phage scaffolding protein [Clostridium sporogenes]MCW6061605.1 phage scaffolding protein [Clostridium sporogenes]MCW6069797.1 phage scaffolding protein [Clostridium sporogenes]MCW6122527.1 phage scaffolding protein [Clostridium sporogenes]NFF78881.1 scaffolding protein [Clostridium sporogenes]NFU88862.1 scaffolding protein [Clostridium sporogenes]
MEELLKKLGYTDEQIQKIIGGMKENKIYTTTEEKIEERYNKLKEQKVALDEQIKTANATIEDLKKNNTDNQTLQSKIGEYESKVSGYEKQIQDMQFNYAIDGALKGANVKNIKAVKALLNMENVKLDGENILGLTDQLETLKESDSYLFWTTISGNEPEDGKSNPSPQEATDLRGALAQKYQ